MGCGWRHPRVDGSAPMREEATVGELGAMTMRHRVVLRDHCNIRRNAAPRRA
jgi:hypothetical protein